MAWGILLIDHDCHSQNWFSRCLYVVGNHIFQRIGDTASGPCNAASGWVGSCVITIKRRRDHRRGLAMKWDVPIRPIESGPLTNREIRELDAFLLAEDGLEYPMDFYTFSGALFRPFQFFDHTGSV